MPLWMLLIRNVYQILGSPPVATFENNRPRENSVYKTCPCVLGGYHGCVCLKISAGLNPASYGICAVKWACNKVWNVSCFMLGCNSKQSMIKKVRMLTPFKKFWYILLSSERGVQAFVIQANKDIQERFHAEGLSTGLDRAVQDQLFQLFQTNFPRHFCSQSKDVSSGKLCPKIQGEITLQLR